MNGATPGGEDAIYEGRELILSDRVKQRGFFVVFRTKFIRKIFNIYFLEFNETVKCRGRCLEELKYFFLLARHKPGT